ncbi:MAG: peptidoglycan editing factor PgeF [Neptuniibacter sp.]
MNFVTAQWQAPANVKAVTTTRLGGYSSAPFDSLNLGDHVDDDANRVEQNREHLLQNLGLGKAPQWLTQVHGTAVIKAQPDNVCRTADACWTDEQGVACVVMTADCLPVFFADSAGTRVAVAHAGWRGLLDGVLEQTLKVFPHPDDVYVWFGPAIGPEAFEVGEEVVEQFVSKQAEAQGAFVSVAGKNDKYLADIYQLASLRLLSSGVKNISGGDMCTYSDKKHFFSYRRDGQTGRMASLIWLDNK